MKQLVSLWSKILEEGEDRADRTGVGTKSVFGGQMGFDLRDRFPIVTIKKTNWKSAFAEMLWFVSGSSSVRPLQEQGIKIWDEWADDNGDLGPVYGVQWRNWGGQTDQLYNLIEGIKASPMGRRHIVTAWNPTEIPTMALPPCHYAFQCYASVAGYLDLMVNIRSWDTALGAPFNVCQYALLTHMIAQCTNKAPRYLIVNYGDAHLYLNHVKPIGDLILTRSPINCPTKLWITNPTRNIDEFTLDDFVVEHYESNEFLRLPIAV